MRAFIVLGSIYTLPAILKTIFEGADKSRGSCRRITWSVLNILVAVTQIGSIISCCMFGISMTKEEKHSIQMTRANPSAPRTISRPQVTNQPRWLWEMPISLIFISLSYWENFADRDLSLLGFTMRINRWKRNLSQCRPRIYLFASVWKICLAIGFAKILQQESIFGLTFSTSVSTPSTLPSTVLSDNVAFVTTMNTNSTSLSTVVNDNISVVRQKREVPDNGNETEHFEVYGILYLHVTSIIILTCCASMACKLSMQRYGFSLPLTLAAPISAIMLVLQCVYQYLPTGVFVCVCPDLDGELWTWHLLWLVTLWLSRLFLLSHVWFPEQHKMETTDRYL